MMCALTFFVCLLGTSLMTTATITRADYRTYLGLISIQSKTASSEPVSPTPPPPTTAAIATVFETQVAKLIVNGSRPVRRRKRFDYEDTYEWEDDDDLTYQDYYEEEEEPNFFQKLATHWRTAGPRLVCVGAFLLLVIIVLCGCLRLACRFWCKSMSESSACCFLPGIKALCQSCYTDPMYERVKELGEMMGIEISYKTYEMIKDRYDPDSGFDPMSTLII